MPPDPNTFLLAGGGTGGHLFPAIAVAEAIRRLRPAATVVFAGTKGRIEARLVPHYGYRFETIWISGIQRRMSIGHLMTPVKILVSLLQSFWLLRRLKPGAVLGTGGYVCGPVLLVASVLGIPTMLHESNSYPGATTKLLAGRVDKVFLAFEDSRQWLRGARETEIVGTPTRSSIATATKAEALRFFGLSPDKPVVLVSGGSQGSTAINAAVFGLLDNPWAESIQFVWQTGEPHFASVTGKLDGRNVGWVEPFIGSMDLAYAAADLVVCRAGAATIAELTQAGKPAVLIPYPHAVADHQTRNAESLVASGAAVLVPESEISSLGSVLQELLRDGPRRLQMGEAAQRLGKPDAARSIAEAMIRAAGEHA